MLSDEEKKAIEYLKRHIIPVYGSKGQIEYLLNDTILNLIKKQFKEIEELKNRQIDFWLSDKEIEERIRNKFVNKDKIKAKIEKLDKEIKVKREIAKNPMDIVSGRLLTDSIVELEKAKSILQSLLNEEE